MKKEETGFGKGWRMIIYALLCYYITGTISGSMNVAVGIFADTYGWNRVILLSLVSIAAAANVPAGFIAGRFCIRYSPKKVAIVLGILYSISLIMIGIATNITLFGAFMVLGFSTSSAWGYNSTPVAIARWFPKRKGIVMGIVTIGVPLGGVNPIIFNTGYKIFGIRGCFLLFEAFSIAALLMQLFLVPDDPHEIGFNPDNLLQDEESPVIEPVEKSEITENTLNVKDILKMPMVWKVAFFLGLQLLFCGGVIMQLVPRLLELGYSNDTAIYMLLIISVGACVGSYVCGIIDTKFGVRTAISITYLIAAMALILNITGNNIFVLLSLIMIGVVMGGASNWSTSLCIDYWGEKKFPQVFSVLQPMIQLVGAAGPAFFAILASVTGGYKGSYLCGAILMLLGFVGFNLFTVPKNLKKEN